MYAAKIGKKTIRGKYITEKKYVNTTNSPQESPKNYRLKLTFTISSRGRM